MDIKQEELKKPRGRGIYALLGVQEEAPALPAVPVMANEQEYIAGENREEVRYLPVSSILPNPEQPREEFNELELSSLSQSILQDGVLQPIVVSEDKHGSGRWILIAGERRLRASKMAGLTMVPALVRSVDNESALRLALIENIQRANLNIIEEARAYSRLIHTYGLTQQQCAEKVGKERSSVANTLRLLSLPAYLQNEIIADRISAGHGRALLTLVGNPKLGQVVEQVISRGLNVRQTEKLCKKLAKNGGKGESGKITSRADLDYFAENLRSYLQTKIQVKGSVQKGKIEISYFSAAELDRLMDLMGAKL
jgi:ParB family chromosome partitioning protein